ncbi:MAG: DUF4143 domain-containing protein, partial [Burkholderiales bacterium]|nr:DUF4143 domain-containing protein [Burkholderiales bacterium]
LNRSEIAAPLGVSVPTVSEWISVLETTGQILVVPPYFENFGKRIVKSPKLYFVDSGLACHLLGLDTPKALSRSPFAGPVFEGFVAAEIAKQQAGFGRRRELYYFRDQRGLEVDFVVPRGSARLAFIEAKASRTARPEAAAGLRALATSAKGRAPDCLLVHGATDNAPEGSTLAQGVRAIGVRGLLARLERNA